MEFSFCRIVCTWRNGIKADLFLGQLSELSLMDCCKSYELICFCLHLISLQHAPVFFAFSTLFAACARDVKIFELEGVSHRLACDSRGSYENLQHQGVKSYCVDRLGYSVTQFMDDPRLDCAPHLYEKIETASYCPPPPTPP